MRALVEYRFNLLDAYVDASGLPTFVVAQEPMKEKFQELLHDLANHNLTARITRVADKLVISIFMKPNLGKPRNRINLLLFAATVGSVAFASQYYVGSLAGYNSTLTRILFSNSGFLAQAIVLAVSIISIVAVHEMGHVLAVRHHRMDATLPYFVPAPPPIGTFGAVISLRGPPGNRDQLFDLGFSGPVAGLATTVAVGLLAFVTAPLISAQQMAQLESAKLVSSLAWPNEPLLLVFLEQLPVRFVPQGQGLMYTSLLLAVEVGALITFLNLLPIWQLDGGHISRATFGDRGHKLVAFAGFAILLLAQYWGFAILLIIFMLATRRPLQGVEPLDDVSPLSKSRKAIFALYLLALAISFIIIA
jgi:membrane-associated protease RseP (regulator of RpoE activity)